ncbi:MAG: SpoIID/LytB domain-containing protein [Lachnospiraceae bacterium]|nr:SpoIID/LytB domain-containing protein [Lachnospiraceae bacterium]
MHNGHMNQSQRMQLKTLICILGLGVLLIIVIARLFMILQPGTEQEEPHIPVIEEFRNVWIMEADGEALLMYKEGEEISYPYELQAGNSKPEQMREQLADIVLTDGVITEIHIKSDKINGKVLSGDATGIEVEGYGRLPLAEDYRGYRIYKTLAMCTVSDLAFGYPYADFVVENGQICGILIVREEAMEYIRVLLKTSDYAGIYHEQLQITADTAFTIQYGPYENRQTEQHAAGELVSIDKSSPYFQGERVLIAPDVLTGKVILQNVSRSQGAPNYRGCMEVQLTEEGMVVINEVLLEEYLYCVVPSEMPASYPDEALQAQAVCARTYAYGHMQQAGYPEYGAHVDDSTSYQVYNNILEQESTTTAVKETYGQLLYTADGNLAGTYYYSTSCGVGTDADIWKTEASRALTYLRGKSVSRQETEAASDMADMLKDEAAFANFIQSKNADDFEVNEGWYRWTYTVPVIDTQRMLGILQNRYQANRNLVLTLQGEAYVSEPIEELDEITDMYIASRGSGGVADELMIKTKEHTYKVISEHNIRYVLNNGESPVVRQDGSEVTAATLLPSAFFVLSAGKEGEKVVGYNLTGGGFGHGVGMSQNGAKNMANSGYTSDEILTFFYEGCSVQNVYE